MSTLTNNTTPIKTDMAEATITPPPPPEVTTTELLNDGADTRSEAAMSADQNETMLPPPSPSEIGNNTGDRQIENALLTDESAEANQSAVEQKASKGSRKASSALNGSDAHVIHTGVTDEEAEEGESAVELFDSKWNSDPEFFTSDSSSSQYGAQLQTSSSPELVHDLSVTTATALFDIHRDNKTRVMEHTTGAACATFLLLKDIIGKLKQEAAVGITRKKSLLEAVVVAAQDFEGEYPDGLTTQDDADERFLNVPTARRSADVVHAVLERELHGALTPGDAKLSDILRGVERAMRYMESFFLASSEYHAESSPVISTPSKAHTDVQKATRKRNAAEMESMSDSHPLEEGHEADQPKKKKSRKATADGSVKPKPWSLAEDLKILRMKADRDVWSPTGLRTGLTAHRKTIFTDWLRSMGFEHNRTWDALEQHLNKLKSDKVTISQLEEQLGLKAGDDIPKAAFDKFPAAKAATKSTKSSSPPTTSEIDKKAVQEDSTKAATATKSATEAMDEEEALEKAEAETEADES